MAALLPARPLAEFSGAPTFWALSLALTLFLLFVTQSFLCNYFYFRRRWWMFVSYVVLPGLILALQLNPSGAPGPRKHRGQGRNWFDLCEVSSALPPELSLPFMLLLLITTRENISYFPVLPLTVKKAQGGAVVQWLRTYFAP